jgi:hypothetical protein
MVLVSPSVSNASGGPKKRGFSIHIIRLKSVQQLEKAGARHRPFTPGKTEAIFARLRQNVVLSGRRRCVADARGLPSSCLSATWAPSPADVARIPVPVAMLHIVRIVAFGADKPALGAGAGPFANPFAMNTFTPVPINFAVALAAQLLWLVKTDRLVAMINQLVALSGMMAIQTPDAAPPVRQFG